MAFVAYMYIEDHDQKKQFKGFTGEEDKTFDGTSVKELSRVQVVDHGIRIPTDIQTGEATGGMNHEPFRVTINMDRVVPHLYKCMTRNVRVNVRIHFFRSGQGVRASGKSDPLFSNWYTVKLEDARIVEMKTRKTLAMEADSNIPDFLDIGFSYYKIIWQDHESKVESEWSWAQKGA